MDVADLRFFEAVARLGSMGRAAEELHTVQSNVTARIRHLEEQLGTPLFLRHARGVALAPAGRRLLPYAHRIASLLAEARRAARDEGVPSGPLVVGSLETTAALRLADHLAGFTTAYPHVDLTLRTGTTSELLEQVLDRQLEGAFVCGPVIHAALEARKFFTEELAILTASSIRSLNDLAGTGDIRMVVLRRGCSYRQRLEEILARRGIPVPRVLEFGTLDALLACVAAGMGITLLPAALVTTARPLARIVAHALPPNDARVETLFVRRRDTYVSTALTAFLASLTPPLAQDGAPIAAE